MKECPVCGVDKGSKLYRHLFDAHGYTKERIEVKAQKRQNRVEATGRPIFDCDFCSLTFTSTDYLLKHQWTKHVEEYTPRCISCPVCHSEVKNHRELAAHARLCHAEDPDDFAVETISFDTTEEYEKWRQTSEEVNVMSRFTSAVRRKADSTVTYMRCNRALCTPSMVSEKTKKAVAYCTAFMNVTKRENSVTVEHCLTHCGHEVRPAMLKLDEQLEEYIKGLLMEGLTVRQVYKRLREKMRGGPKNRLYFTIRRDIRNIASKCLVRPERLDSLDTVSVQMRVDVKSENDGIQYFSPAHDASGDGYVLVIINLTQRTWLAKYGRRALSVDDTFNLTAYSLRLAAIVVADEWDKALPAGYLLSYWMTEVEVGILFNHVKKFLPSFYTDYFMTDDTNTFWNGFKKAFPTTRLSDYCKNLLEAFKDKVREICLTRDRSLFITKYTSLLKFLRENDECAMAEYLENSWSHKVDQWAAFGRLGSCVSTSMLCEWFHKKLKHDILEGRPNVRMDSLIQLLITLITEMDEEREIMMERGLEEARYRLQEHHKSHALAIKKYHDRQQIIKIDGIDGIGMWEICDNTAAYRVEEQYCPCDAQCNNHCLRAGCGACPYSFTCTCTRDVKSGISCEHVHAALLYAPSGRKSVEDSRAEIQLAEPSPGHESEELEEVVVVEESDNNSEERRRSTDIRDHHKDTYQRIEMMYAATRTHALGLLNNTDPRITEGWNMLQI